MQLATEILLGALVVGLVAANAFDLRLPRWSYLALGLVTGAAAVATSRRHGRPAGPRVVAGADGR